MSEPSFQSVPSAPLTGATRARPSRWEAAFAAHYVALCEYVLRFVGSAEAAEDVVQDLFLHLWDTRGPRDALRLTRRYLYVAARNRDRKSTRLNSSHVAISYAVFCLQKKTDLGNAQAKHQKHLLGTAVICPHVPEHP